jgi:proteasome lid subunit RPN8/RPN11
VAAITEASSSSLLILKSLNQQMKQEVLSWLPEEACGLLFGRDSTIEIVIPITNDLHSPTQFRMNPTEQVKAFLEMEAAGFELIAVYHSHPAGPDHPSQQDIEEFAYPGTAYIIWFPHHNNWSCNAYTIHEQAYQPQDIILVEG